LRIISTVSTILSILLNDSFTVEIDIVLDVDEFLIHLKFELVDHSPVLVVRPIGDFTRLSDHSMDKFRNVLDLIRNRFSQEL
jgi:hypothetical protein